MAEKTKDLQTETMKTKSLFEELSNLNVNESTKEKLGLTYFPWAKAWKEIKGIDPDASFVVHEQQLDDYGTTRPWFVDGSGNAWVKVSVTIRGKTETEWLPIMGPKNQPLKGEDVTSTAANKAVKRCFVKATALHGLGLYIYENEDLPEQDKRIKALIDEVRKLLREKAEYGKEAKEKTIKLAKEAQKEAFPDLDDELITGNIGEIDDEDILESLKLKVMAIRKPPKVKPTEKVAKKADKGE